MPQIVTLLRSIPLKLLIMVLGIAWWGSLASLHGQSHAKKQPPRPQTAQSGDQISGMYTFLRDGEFVQVTVEEGKVSGFVSRFGERDSDRGVFLDQFFSKASLDGKKLSFTTKPIHGTWYEFNGMIGRGDAKTPDQEGYWSIQGTLRQFDLDDNKNVSSKSLAVTFKSFPQNLEDAESPKQ
jgi:hypothetical protein